MSAEAISKAVQLGREVGHVFVATADKDGLPHVATAGTVRLISEYRISIEDWFCPGTIQNVGENPLISMVAWDPGMDLGYQLTGRVKNIQETAMLNGFSPEIDEKVHMPQTERILIVRVDTVLAFSRAPHTDDEE